MTKRELTTMTVKHEPKSMITEQWDLMPIGTTFIHPVDKHLCLKISDVIMFDLQDKETIDVEVCKQLIWDFGREEPIDFELVDISIRVKEKS